MAAGRILIVDDNPVNLKLVRVTLDGEGYDLAVARSAEEALVLIESSRPDLILLDIQLPGIDGLELTRRLRAEARTAGIGIIVVTAFVTTLDERNAFDAGCDGFIRKPIDTRLLGPKVRAFLTAATSARAEPGLHLAGLEYLSFDADADVHGERNG